MPVVPVAQIAAIPPQSSMDTNQDVISNLPTFDFTASGLEDIDTEFEDPQLASEYAKDIYIYMRQLEVSFFNSQNRFSEFLMLFFERSVTASIPTTWPSSLA